MQPDTTVLKMVRDVNDKLSERITDSTSANERNSDGQETSSGEAEPVSNDEIITGNEPDSRIQVVPLYTPQGSAIKFFCVHPSHRYAMSLVPISTGFQGQVKSTTPD